MARDSQAALVALNRFGFGARGGASGDFVDAASDPRGFVKAGTQPSPTVRCSNWPACCRRRRSARRYSIISSRSSRRAMPSGLTAPGSASEAPPQPPPDANAQRRNLSLTSIAKDITAREPAKESAKEPAMQAPANTSGNAAMAPAEAMQPNPPKPPPQPLNIIQKTFRAEALARLQRAVIADCGFVERLVVFWSNHFCISANKGGLARMWAGSFEREAIRPHVLGRFGNMLKAVEQHPAMLFFLDNQQSLGPDFARRAEPEPRPERKSRARDHGVAHARRRWRLYAGRRDVAGACDHRLDLCRRDRASSARPARSCSTPMRISPARSG